MCNQGRKSVSKAEGHCQSVPQNLEAAGGASRLLSYKFGTKISLKTQFFRFCGPKRKFSKAGGSVTLHMPCPIYAPVCNELLLKANCVKDHDPVMKPAPTNSWQEFYTGWLPVGQSDRYRYQPSKIQTSSISG